MKDVSMYKGVYKNLQKGRWFHTVWVALPESSRSIIRENIQDLKPYCEWLSTMTGNHSKDIPHITLTYLGFSDELNADHVKKDKKLFEDAISRVGKTEIEVGDINLWTRVGDGGKNIARLNWEITKPEPLIKLHKELLKIPNYYLFENLEGDNYNPHISLGAVDMSNHENYEKVVEKLDKTKFERKMFTLKRFELNLTTPERSELISLS